MDKEDKFLLSHIDDLIRQRDGKNIPTCSDYLDLRQQSLVRGYCAQKHIASFSFWGGYDDAERCVCGFLPDWSDDARLLPVQAVRVQTAASLVRPLTHRDYLGALMALGLRREKIGDILVSDDGADILALSDVVPVLCAQFTQAGQARFEAHPIELCDLRQPEQKMDIRRDTVPSLRLDCVAGSAFSLSRSDASAFIEAGRVFVNGQQILKKDAAVRPGDKLTLRGKGKAVFLKTSGVSKKDRVFIELGIMK